MLLISETFVSGNPSLSLGSDLKQRSDERSDRANRCNPCGNVTEAHDPKPLPIGEDGELSNLLAQNRRPINLDRDLCGAEQATLSGV